MPRSSPIHASLLASALAAPAPAWAACEAPSTPAEVARLVERVEASWLEMSVEGVAEAAGAIREAVPCVQGTLTPTAIARVHRALGLARVVEGDLEGAGQTFAAARYADPGLGIAESLAPEGTPVRDLFLRPIPYVPGAPLGAPHRGTVLVDGSPLPERPTARPTVMQHLQSDGAVAGTWMLEPGDPLPPEPWRDPNKGVRIGLRIGAGVAGAGALALLGGASWAASVHGDPSRRDLTVSDLERLRDRSRRFTLAGGALGAVALAGVGVAGVLP